MQHKPWVGLTPALNNENTYLTVREAFCQALIEAGALPVILPLTEDLQVLSAYAEQLDGVVFTGGGDVDPALFSQPCRPWSGRIDPRRDAMELALCRLLMAASKPVLGVCRGMQVMNIACGGDIYQDIEREFHTDCPIAHRQPMPAEYSSHAVHVTEGTRLATLVKQSELRVNSLHHQAVNRLGEGLIGAAYSEDGLCEALEAPKARFFLGVQWHPERLYPMHNEQRAIFTAFVDSCR